MISCIISSKDQYLIAEITENINATIGVPYEVLVIDSTKCSRGISEAYNTGARQSKYDILCFMHKDILFKTPEWGKKIIAHFEKDDKLGIIGIAGSTVKTKTLSSWWQPVINGYEPKRINIIHSFPNVPPEHLLINPLNEIRSEVATLDGVMLIIKKSVWNEFNFNEKTLMGFHCYDMDICFMVKEKYKVAVAYDILVEHFSKGYPDAGYFKDLVEIHKKYRKKLPIMQSAVDKNSFFFHELYSFFGMYKLTKKMKLPLKIRYGYFLQLSPYFIYPYSHLRMTISFVFQNAKKKLFKNAPSRTLPGK